MTYHKNFQSLDERSKKSWHTIREAFVELVLSKHYDEIKTTEIIRKSGVARSTFYEHFNNKDAVLAQSLSPPLSILAKSVHENHVVEAIQPILQHFWEKRSFSRLIFEDTPRKSVSTMLTQLLEQQITLALKEKNQRLIITNDHAASQIAEAQLALIHPWLLGKAKSSDRNLAVAIKKTSNAIYNALVLDDGNF